AHRQISGFDYLAGPGHCSGRHGLRCIRPACSHGHGGHDRHLAYKRPADGHLALYGLVPEHLRLRLLYLKFQPPKYPEV
ncbi:hypothetical protein OFM04_31370, partial [Escherichia coli]|nr:hypothetical protein [Escherichia coli]